MKGIHLLGLVIIVSFLLLGISYFKEGFQTTETELEKQKQMVQKRLKQFNLVGDSLTVVGNTGIIGEKSDNLLNSIISTRNESNQRSQKLFTKYPLESKETELSLLIKKCEAVKSANCNAFDNSDFTKDCGICLDIGKNSKEQPHSGGLVLMDADKKEAQDKVKGTPFLAPYQPVIGTCPTGKLVASKKECLRLQNQLQCEKGSTFENPRGCSQCFQSGEYSIVDPNDSDSKNLIVGGGTLLVWGSGGTFTFQNNSNNTQQIYLLSSTPREIRLVGGEGAQFSISVKAINVPVDYDETEVYKVEDLIIFNDKVYRMNDGVGLPGFSPSSYNQQQRWDDLGSYQNYSGLKVKAVPQISGILIGQTNIQGAIFQIDMNRLIILDKVSGRKPRVTGTAKSFQYDSTTFGQVMLNPVFKLSPGFGEETMLLQCTQPFSFVDIQTQESARCPSSPFVTKEASATFLQSDPCYKKGSAPGKYSVECLQGLFLSNGCTSQGKGFPVNENNGLNATSLNLADLANYIYEKAIIAATGVNSSGIKQEINAWSDASEFCTGKKINSPCDISMGIVSDDCIYYLWDNTGDATAAGSAYASSQFQLASSDSEDTKKRRFCTREGSLSPKDKFGKSNRANLSYWKKYKTADAVKKAMALIHQNSNDKNLTDVQKKPFLKQCYGINLGDPPKVVTRSMEGIIQDRGNIDEINYNKCANAVETTGFIPHVTWGSTPNDIRALGAECDRLLCPYFENVRPGKFTGGYEKQEAYCKRQKCITAVETTGFIPQVTWGSTPNDIRALDRECDILLCPYFENVRPGKFTGGYEKQEAYCSKIKKCITAVETTGFIPRVTWGSTPPPIRASPGSECDRLLCPYFEKVRPGKFTGGYGEEEAFCKSLPR